MLAPPKTVTDRKGDFVYLNNHPRQRLSTEHSEQALSLRQHEGAHIDDPHNATLLALLALYPLSLLVEALDGIAADNAARRMANDDDVLAILDNRAEVRPDSSYILGETRQGQGGAANAGEGDMHRRVLGLGEQTAESVPDGRELPCAGDDENGRLHLGVFWGGREVAFLGNANALVCIQKLLQCR